MRYLVQARVTRDGGQVRAAVQLVHIEEDRLVFSENMAGPADNLAVVQTRIVTRLKQEAHILSGGGDAEGG